MPVVPKKIGCPVVISLILLIICQIIPVISLRTLYLDEINYIPRTELCFVGNDEIANNTDLFNRFAEIYDKNGNKIYDPLENMSALFYKSPDVPETNFEKNKPIKISVCINMSSDNGGFEKIVGIIGSYSIGSPGIYPLHTMGYTLISFDTNISELPALLGRISAEKSVVYIKEDGKLEGEMYGLLPSYGIYPGIRTAPDTGGDSSAVIAVIDTGVDPSHPMLDDKVILWKDFTSTNSSVPYDPSQHGTFVSSVIAGKPLNISASGNHLPISRVVYRDWSAVRLTAGFSYIDIPLAFNVTSSGNLTLYGKWNKGSAVSTVNVTELALLDAEGNYLKKVNITSEDSFFTLEYNITSPGIYKAGFIWHVDDNSDNKFRLFIKALVPFDTGGSSELSGVAPSAPLAVFRAYYETEYIAALDWILQNGKDYNITVINMSFRLTGSSSPLALALVNQLAREGFIPVAAAGNEYFGGNYAGTNIPAGADYIITVGAVGNNNHLASYSSQGGVSVDGATIKPDILAPGGEFPSKYSEYLPIYAADTNGIDITEDGVQWSDLNPNDTRPGVGTSFSAAFVSGVISLMINASGGFTVYNYSAENCRWAKNLLLLSATETYPLTRNVYGDEGANPLSDRGGKDIYEGYGRINPKSVLDLLAKTPIDTSVIPFVTNATLSSITSGFYIPDPCAVYPLALKRGYYYNISLTVPNSADFDLYLYNSTGDIYGQPALLVRSVNSVGENENILFAPQKDGVYYLAIKAISGSGKFYLNITGKWDNIPPERSVISIPSNGTVIAGIYTFGLDCNDGESFIDSISLEFFGTVKTPSGPAPNSSEPIYTVNASYTSTVAFNTSILPDGCYFVFPVAFDVNYNSLRGKGIIVYIDNTAPICNFTVDIRESIFDAVKVYIRFNVTDEIAGVDSVRIYSRSEYDYGPIGLYTVGGADNFSSLFIWTTDERDDGPNYIWFVVTDTAGNTVKTSAEDLLIRNSVLRIYAAVILGVLGVLGFILDYKLALYLLLRIDLATLVEKAARFPEYTAESIRQGRSVKMILKKIKEYWAGKRSFR